MDKRPKWTVLYNIVSEGSTWIGTGREFFDDEETAKKRYDKIPSGASMRPYHKVDDRYFGAVHRIHF